MGDDVDISALTIEQYMALIQDKNRLGIVKTMIGDDVEFEINSNFIRELRRKLFASTNDEDAHEMVFPITLKGRALRWKRRLPAGVINTWDLLEKEFIWKYCSPFKTAKKLEEIHNFKQEMYETLYQAWERYNDLLFKCPQHDLNNHQEVQIFYTGLDISTCKLLDSRGFITLMTPTQALKSIQIMADHSHNWEVHKIKALEDEGDMDDGWEITVKDVERLRQFLTPTIQTLPNLEPVVQPYMPLGQVHDKEKIVRKEDQDYDICHTLTMAETRERNIIINHNTRYNIEKTTMHNFKCYEDHQPRTTSSDVPNHNQIHNLLQFQ
ncbi:ribonuclease H-like domain-containing protein [Tanacetum coccineum]